MDRVMSLRGGRVSDLSWVVGDRWLLLGYLVQIIHCILFRFYIPLLLCPQLAGKLNI